MNIKYVSLWESLLPTIESNYVKILLHKFAKIIGGNFWHCVLFSYLNIKGSVPGGLFRFSSSIWCKRLCNKLSVVVWTNGAAVEGLSDINGAREEKKYIFDL